MTKRCFFYFFIMLAALPFLASGCADKDAETDLTPTGELVLYMSRYKYFAARYNMALFVFQARNPDVNVTVKWFGDSNNHPGDVSARNA